MGPLPALVIAQALLLSGAFRVEPPSVVPTPIACASEPASPSSESGAAPLDRGTHWRGPESTALTGMRAWQAGVPHAPDVPAVFGARILTPPRAVVVLSASRFTPPPPRRLTDSLRI